MQPSRMSGTRISPIEQFTGMEIDAARDTYECNSANVYRPLCVILTTYCGVDP